MTDETQMASQAVRGAMTVGELIEAGLTPAQARSEMERRVFRPDLPVGQSVPHDKNNRPVEVGIGSPGNLTENHFLAMAGRFGEGPEAAARARADAEKKGLWPRKRDEQEEKF